MSFYPPAQSSTPRWGEEEATGFAKTQNDYLEEVRADNRALVAENAALRADLIEKENEIWTLKDELDMQQQITAQILSEAADNKAQMEHEKDLYQARLDLAITRIGVQWQQISEDKTNLYMARGPEEIAQAQVNLERSQAKLGLTQEELAAVCLSGDTLPSPKADTSNDLPPTQPPPGPLPSTSQPSRSWNRARAPEPEPVTSYSYQPLPPAADASSNKPWAATIPPSWGVPSGVSFEDEPVFPAQRGAVLHQQQLPEGIFMTKEQLEAAKNICFIKPHLGELFVVGADLFWQDFPRVADLLMPTKKLNEAGEWLDQSVEIMATVKPQAKEVLVAQKNGRYAYVGSYLIGQPNKIAFNTLGAQERAVVIEKTLCVQANPLPNVLEIVRGRYEDDTLHVALFELRRTGYSDDVRELMLAAGGKETRD